MMKPHFRLAAARQQKGLTQEELADLSGLSVRTIQRIESDESIPRSYTLKAIAAALGYSYEELLAVEEKTSPVSEERSLPDDLHFLRLFNLSCFSYLVIPWVHFIIPNYLLKKESNLQAETIELGRKLIRQQVYWIVILHTLMLLTLAYNLIQVTVFNDRSNVVSYLWPFLFMYFANAVIIFRNATRIGRQF